MSQRKLWRYALLLMLTMGGSFHVMAKEFSFAIHPILPESETRQHYQPLMEYLAGETGHTFRIVTNSNFLTHWQTTKRDKYDLVLDGPQFTGYRVNKLDYTVLARFPNVVSYTLVAGEDEFIMEASELIGKRVATTPSPALGALRLQQLFPNPLRQPVIVETDDSASAAERVLSGNANAAIIPAPMVGAYPELITVKNTEQVPAPAISVSPSVGNEVRGAIREALLSANESRAGRVALESINIEGFVPSSGNEYSAHAELLKGMWQY